MYLGITQFNTAGLYYFPYILMRAFIFILIGTLFVFFDIFSIMFLMLFNTFCYIWYFKYEPHSGTIRKVQEACNESFSMIAAYHLMTFSNWVVEPTYQFYAGYSLYGFILLLILLNMIYIGYEFITKKIRDKKREEKK